MNGRFIDFHAHVLPQADHGSDDIETSLKQLELAEEAGIGIIVATPHFYPERHTVRSFFERRDEAYKELASHNKNIEIVCGAEVLLCEGIYDLPELEKLRIGKTSSILIELPVPVWSEVLIDSLLRIKPACGLNVILAHVDRYEPDDIEDLFALGLKGQINASALGSIFKRRRYLEWIGEGNVIALGSDVHGVGKAYTEYAKAMQVLGKHGRMLQNSMKSLISENEAK